METLFTNTSVLQLVVAALILVQVVAILFGLKLSRSVTQHKLALSRLQSEQNALLNGSLGLGRKVLQINHRLEDVSSTQNEMLQPDFSEQAIETASDMLRSGATIDEVIQSCRLSQGEVELLKQMLPTQIVH